ncbi:inducible alternative oxidase 2 [Borealophlyctis nickersoniae]|nr:inducible alternative oxidase 2 [Borealophlyctis nickersoniae]
MGRAIFSRAVLRAPGLWSRSLRQRHYSTAASPAAAAAGAPSSNVEPVHFDPLSTLQGGATSTKKRFVSQELSREQLEKLDIGVGTHRKPVTIGDRIAYGIVKLLRKPCYYFYRPEYIHPAVTLETISAVPGMVAGMSRHLISLRKMRHDGGWIYHLLNEAENERAHLMIWMYTTQPTLQERLFVTGVQGVLFATYLVIYAISPVVGHRLTGYFNEDGVAGYTLFLKAIDEGKIENSKAPPPALEYYKLPPDGTIRDVVLAVRTDKASHRDINHNLADRLVADVKDLRQPYRPELDAVGKDEVRFGPDGVPVERSDLVVRRVRVGVYDRIRGVLQRAA